MPKGGRRISGKPVHDHKQADITLDDFANSKVSATRLKKSATNSLVREVNQLSLDGGDDLSKTLEDFDENGEFYNEPETSKGKGIKSKTELLNSGVEYPVDIWFILADYIRPEDVQVFAGICKGSSSVVKTFQFWMKLYKRYYSSNTHLPERLQPDQIRKSVCVRACVIRSLFYTYPLFAKRTTRSILDEEMYNLVPLKCVSVWHTNSNNKWCFFFKFQSAFCFLQRKSIKHPLPATCDSWSDATENDISPVRDIEANPEDGCRVLCVSCLHYTAVMPSIMGARLADIKVMMKDAHHHIVQLYFANSSYQCSPRHKKSVPKGGGGDVVLLDCVESSQVYHWWHPKYPFLT